MSKHRRDTGFQIYNSALCGHVLERRNILICNRTLFTSNTCDSDNIETINHVPDFMRMNDQKHNLSNAESAEFTSFSRCLGNRVCLEEVPEEF